MQTHIYNAYGTSVIFRTKDGIPAPGIKVDWSLGEWGNGWTIILRHPDIARNWATDVSGSTAEEAWRELARDAWIEEKHWEEHWLASQPKNEEVGK